jgi:hypothetical protein
MGGRLNRSLYTWAMSKLPSPTATDPAPDAIDWSQTCACGLHALGLSLTDHQLKGVAKGLARMAQVGAMAIDESHRDFKLTLQQVRHV